MRVLKWELMSKEWSEQNIGFVTQNVFKQAGDYVCKHAPTDTYDMNIILMLSGPLGRRHQITIC